MGKRKRVDDGGDDVYVTVLALARAAPFPIRLGWRT